jgi:predicted ATP-dependent endonuclease of OLD family
MFRNIIDSGQIDFEPDVTCLVGKNESGKTAVLQALHRQNPAPYSTRFDAFDDYPRWRYVDDRRDGLIEQAVPIECIFELDDEDVAAVVDELGPRVLRSRKIKRSLNYAGEAFIAFDVDESAALTNYLDSAHIPEDQRSLIKSGSGPEDVRDGTAFGNNVNEKNQAEADALAHQVALKFQDRSAWTITKDILKRRLPQFFYFGQYEIMPGRIDLSQLFASDDAPGQSGLQAARALLRLAGAEKDVLTADEFEERKAELEAISARLSREVSRYWTQNENLLVEIDADNTQARAGAASPEMVRYIDVRVRDTRHGYSGNFTQRSSGFQWFFSFLAAFSEFENKGRGVIVLLDEPALNLHGQAQADFLRFINERLAAKSQVIYATHSPFMVESTHLDRVRVIEDNGIEVGSVVNGDLSAAADDSLLPIRAALGHDIAENLSLGPDNEVVAGTSDVAVMQKLREHVMTAADDEEPVVTQRKPQSDGGWRFWTSDGWWNFWEKVGVVTRSPQRSERREKR